MCERQGPKGVSISEKSINCCRNSIGLIQIRINYLMSTSELSKLRSVKHKGESLRKARKEVPDAAICHNTCSTNRAQCLLLGLHPLKHNIGYTSKRACAWQAPPQSPQPPPLPGTADFCCRCNNPCRTAHGEPVSRHGCASRRVSPPLPVCSPTSPAGTPRLSGLDPSPSAEGSRLRESSENLRASRCGFGADTPYWKVWVPAWTPVTSSRGWLCHPLKVMAKSRWFLSILTGSIV